MINWKFWQKDSPRLDIKSKLYAQELLHLMNTDVLAASAQGAMNLFRTSSAVSIPVRLIANTTAMITPVLKTEEGKVVKNNDLVRLLKNPKYGLSSFLFFKGLSIHQSIVGNSYVWAGGNINRPPLAIDKVSPVNIQLNTLSNGEITEINVTTGPYQGTYVAKKQGVRTRYILNNFSEIGLISGFSSRTDDRSALGESPLLAVGPEIQQLLEGATHNTNLLKNGGTLSTIFSLKGDITDDQFKDAASAIMAKYQGPNRAGAIGVMAAEDVDIKQFGNTPKDLDFEKLQKLARKIVALQYGVPIALVDNEKSTFNNLSTSNEMLFDNGCEPVITEILSGLEFFLFPRFKMEIDRFNLTFDRTDLPILRQRFVRELKERKDAGVETPNELRELINREPLSEGGDDLYWPVTQAPVGSDVFTGDNPRVLDEDADPEDDPKKPEPDDEDDDDDEDEDDDA